MKIGSQLQFSSILNLSFILLLITILVYSTLDTTNNIRSGRYTENIVKNIVDMNTLMNQYAQKPSPELKTQIENTYIDTTNLLTRDMSTSPKEMEILNFIGENLISIHQIFFGSKQLTRTISENGNISGEQESLLGQTLIKTNAIVASAHQLSAIKRLELERSQTRSLLILLAFTAMLTVILLVTSSINDKRVIKPLLKLTNQMNQAVRSGHLERPIDDEGNDEISDLSHAFNKMSEKIRKSYKTVEENNSNLSETIKKTEQQNKLLQDAETATINILEDLANEKTKLEKATARDSAIISSIGDGLIATDTETRIILVNKAFEDLMGWKAEEIIGKPVTAIVSVEDEEKNQIPYEKRSQPRALFTGKKIINEPNLYYVRKNNTRFPVSVTVTPIIGNNEIVGAIEVFRDITHEKNVDTAKSEFVSLASHQLRTPLSTVGWYTEMLLSGDVGKVSSKQKKYLTEIYTGNQRMINLVNSLLNVSRLELGTFTIEPTKASLQEICEATLRELKPKIKSKKLKIITNFDNKLPNISIDINLTRIVFENLLTNAVKYTPSEGTITVTLKKGKKNALFSVKDTGLGIPSHQQVNIFNKLFRADNVLDVETDGTGLGLYIVKSILDNAGGKVSFKSTQNKGTTFSVTLPLSGMRRKRGQKTLVKT